MFKIKINFSIYILVVTSLVAGLHGQEEENFCEGKAHYNSLSITCCASKKYSSLVPNPFSNDDAMKDCSNDDAIKATNKLTTKSWLLYSCLLKKKINGEITLKSFTDFMVARFPQPVQDEIRNSLTKLKMSLPQEPVYQRKKRNLRQKRDEDTDKNNSEEGKTDAPTNNNDDASKNMEPTENTAEKGEGAGENTNPTDGTVDDKGAGENTNPTDKTENGEDADKKTEKTDAESSEATSKTTEKPDSTTGGTTIPPRYSKTSIYNYLSVFDYQHHFQDQIPEETKTLLRIWDAYYISEFEACQTLNGSDFDKIASYGTNRCFSWIMRTARGGECCGQAPIPIPLLNDPSFEMEAIHNTTAQKIFNLAGTYTWTNYSFSTNIMRCNRLATAVLLNQVTTDHLSQEIDNYIASNATRQPDYKAIAESLVPLHFPQFLKEQIVTEILPVKDPEDTKDLDEKEKLEKQQFRRLDKDSDLQIISNVNYTIYHWAAPHEWDKIEDDNKVRYVLWTCDAYRMISQRIKYFDTTPYCY